MVNFCVDKQRIRCIYFVFLAIYVTGEKVVEKIMYGYSMNSFQIYHLIRIETLNKLY